MTSQEISIQRVGVETAALLAELHGFGFEKTPERAWTNDEFETLLALPGTFGLVAMFGDEPAGFILIRQVADEAEILTLTVRPEYRRRGLAEGLLDHLKAQLQDTGDTQKIFLEVREDNRAARALYRKLGFGEIGRRKNYYTGQDAGDLDAVVMACSFS